MDELHSQRAELINVRADLDAIRAGLTQAASQPAPAASGTFGEMEITAIIMTYNDKGDAIYKAKGVPYQKYGARLWSEVLPALGIDPLTLRPGTNQIDPIRARVLLGETTNRETGAKGVGPIKVTGRA
jgi:hypothetical protein